MAATPPRLPSFVSELIGRDDELRSLERVLEQARFVTVVGPGGVGKTRLTFGEDGSA